METLSDTQKLFSAVCNLDLYGDIIALRKVLDEEYFSEYIVLRRGNEITPFVTHRMIVRVEHGDAIFESGHYFYPEQEKEAFDDFCTR